MKRRSFFGALTALASAPLALLTGIQPTALPLLSEGSVIGVDLAKGKSHSDQMVFVRCETKQLSRHVWQVTSVYKET